MSRRRRWSVCRVVSRAPSKTDALRYRADRHRGRVSAAAAAPCAGTSKTTRSRPRLLASCAKLPAARETPAVSASRGPSIGIRLAAALAAERRQIQQQRIAVPVLRDRAPPAPPHRVHDAHLPHRLRWRQRPCCQGQCMAQAESISDSAVTSAMFGSCCLLACTASSSSNVHSRQPWAMRLPYAN